MVNKKSLGDVVREEVQKPQDPMDSKIKTLSTEPASGSTRRKNPTKADLEQQVTELKQALDASQHQEAILQEKIQELEQLIQEKDQQMTQLKQEAEEAEKMILQLSEMNTELSKELEGLKQEKTALTVAQPQQPTTSALVPRRPQHALTQPGETEDFAKNTWLL